MNQKGGRAWVFPARASRSGNVTAETAIGWGEIRFGQGDEYGEPVSPVHPKNMFLNEVKEKMTL
jgi:hypothetical protein